MKHIHIGFSDKPITTRREMIWRLYDVLGDLNRARDEMQGAAEVAREAGGSSAYYSILYSEIAKLGKAVGELLEGWERKVE